MTTLTPPDFEQCQCIIDTPVNPFSLGGSQRTVKRCDKQPSHLLNEKRPGLDGLKGSMTVCDEHLEIFKAHNSDYDSIVEIKPITRLTGEDSTSEPTSEVITDGAGNTVAVVDNVPADNNKTWDAE